MGDQELKNLADRGSLKREPPDRAEFNNLVTSGRKRLADAKREDLSSDSRFDLAYNASHSFALAALRLKGYRPDHNRFTVFQVLVHTTDLESNVGRILSKCHDQRNLAEYQGHTDMIDQLLADLIDCATRLQAAVLKLSNPA